MFYGDIKMEIHLFNLFALVIATLFCLWLIYYATLNGLALKYCDK